MYFQSTLEEFEDAVYEAREGLNSNERMIEIKAILSREQIVLPPPKAVSAAKNVLAALLNNPGSQGVLPDIAHFNRVESPDDENGIARLNTMSGEDDGNGMVAQRRRASSSGKDFLDFETNRRTDQGFERQGEPLSNLCLICIPSLFLDVKVPKNPRKLLMIVNVSARWIVRLFLVQPGCRLLPRAVLRVGERHSEWTSSDDIWAISVHANVNLVTGFATGSVHLTECDTRGGHPETIPTRFDGAFILVVKPCASALDDSRTTSLLWTPSLSLSIAQRVRVTPGEKVVLKSSNTNPHLSIQVLDG